MPAYHIHITGRVQGVGFRPWVYRLATAAGLCGWVSNDPDGVRITVQGAQPELDAFRDRLRQSAPPRARVRGVEARPVAEGAYPDFQIRASGNGRPARLELTPDLGLCPECRAEVLSRGDRREGYAFTTCTHCGPRYSIITELPYDRPLTTMGGFQLCPACAAEYHDPLDRRYYAQTITCPGCPVPLRLLDGQGRERATQGEALDDGVERLRQGQIIAVKGIGGYLLLADATSAETLRRLRERKCRPTKPFALLYEDLNRLKADVTLSVPAAAELESIESPIVLLPLRRRPASGIRTELIAPDLGQIGAMLPYSPLLWLLSRRFGRPLVATSGNRSGSPIFFRDEDALHGLAGIADAFLVNDREIVVPQDDSVVRFAAHSGQRIVVRRSRGLAPSLVHPAFEKLMPVTLALGAQLKSTFGLYLDGQTYVSQYFGDLDNYEVEQAYGHTLDHLLRLFDVQPAQLLVDAHPGYASTHLGQTLAERWQVPLLRVPHHRAHFAAVLAENDLLETEEPVLGVIWDGLGWGEDGHLWGGEFIRYDGGRFDRLAHWQYYDYLLGDKMSREPRLSALSLSRNLPLVQAQLLRDFNSDEWSVYRRSLHCGRHLQTSSIGRLFDAVAAVLGLANKTSFEGEAALYLEALAREAWQYDPATVPPFDLRNPLDPAEVLNRVYSARHQPTGIVAARFHRTLVESMARVARRHGLRRLACSGGVFQNGVLVDMLRYDLGNHHELIFHQQLAPNDENIAFGQLTLAYLAQHGPGGASLTSSKIAETCA